ncbi:MAG: hypothetical protein P4L31_03000 [Candidatus Babeliales bacterium]|nr:hypothetical protein [Candidatus Babeliales bacterium]
MKLKCIALSIGALLYTGMAFSIAIEPVFGSQDTIFGSLTQAQFKNHPDIQGLIESYNDMPSHQYTNYWFITSVDKTDPNSIWRTFEKRGKLDLIYALNLRILQKKWLQGLVRKDLKQNPLTNQDPDDIKELLKGAEGDLQKALYAVLLALHIDRKITNASKTEAIIKNLKTLLSKQPVEHPEWMIGDKPVMDKFVFDVVEKRAFDNAKK